MQQLCQRTIIRQVCVPNIGFSPIPDPDAPHMCTVMEFVHHLVSSVELKPDACVCRETAKVGPLRRGCLRARSATGGRVRSSAFSTGGHCHVRADFPWANRPGEPASR